MSARVVERRLSLSLARACSQKSKRQQLCYVNCVCVAAALVEKMAELKVAPAVIIDEPTVDENTIMRAYEALMAEDPRWGIGCPCVWGGPGRACSQMSRMHGSIHAGVDLS